MLARKRLSTYAGAPESFPSAPLKLLISFYEPTHIP